LEFTSSAQTLVALITGERPEIPCESTQPISAHRRLRNKRCVAKLIEDIFVAGARKKYERYLTKPEKHRHFERLTVRDINVQEREIDSRINQSLHPDD
jgi:hypothetical protein